MRAGLLFEGGLTPVEMERLQGFPDGWNSVGLSVTARYRAMGNAVAVPVAEWVTRRLVDAQFEWLQEAA